MLQVKSYTKKQLFEDFENNGYTCKLDGFDYCIYYQNMICCQINTKNQNISLYSFPFEHLHLIQSLIVKLSSLTDKFLENTEDTGLDIVKVEVTQSWDCSNGECGTEEVEYTYCPYCNQLLIDLDGSFDYTDCAYCPTCGGKVKGWDK